MDELNAAPSSTEPTAEQLASMAMGTNAQEAGAAALGEHVPNTGLASESPVAVGVASQDAPAASSTDTSDAPAVAESGEIGGGADTAAPNTATSTTSDVSDPGSVTAMGDAADNVGAGIDAPSHLLMLDAMLAEIERKIGAGIHLFAHEVTAARDHLAKLL